MARATLLFQLMLLLFALEMQVGAKRTPKREEGYVITMEPKIDNCPNFKSQYLSVHDLTFKKVDKVTVAFSGFVNLTVKTEAPISATLTIDQLKLGTYVFYMVAAYDDICRDIGREGQIWSGIMSQVNIKSCPISPREITMNNFTISLADHVKLGPEHQGRFKWTLTMDGKVNGEVTPMFCQTFYIRVDKS